MANGFGQLIADIPGAFARGQQFRQQEALRPLQLQQAEQNLQFGQLKQQQVEQGIETEEQKIKSQNLFNAVARIRLLPDNQKGAAIRQNIAEIKAKNGDSTESEQALQLAQAGNFEELNQGLDNLFQVGVTTGFLKAEPVTKAAADFTLRPGQTRFGPGGEQIASVAAKAVTDESATKAIIPPVLLQGLDPGVANKGAAAFEAAGGGDKGLTAFQKIVDAGTEQQRRLASPQILKESFPRATPAELVQLQSTMDAAKTTETGLKSAAKVREEQRRTKKAKGFQERAIQLLDSILANDELDDVLGSIEGAIDFRLQDSESELIADIEEAGNILTADNLNLMSGVLSETDIKILKNLAGGGLNRKRSVDRFTKDVTSIRDKLSSQLVVTIDDQAEQREAVQIPTAPPSGREGGKLMTDAQGNKAFVFPDGSFEEV